MSIQKGFDAVNEYFGPMKKEAFAKIGSPYRKRKAEKLVEYEDESLEYDASDNDSDVELVEENYDLE